MLHWELVPSDSGLTVSRARVPGGSSSPTGDLAMPGRRSIQIRTISGTEQTDALSNCSPSQASAHSTRFDCRRYLTAGRRSPRSRPGDQPLHPIYGLPATLLALQLAQKILSADQVVVEDLTGGLEKAPNERVAQRVPDAHTFLPA